MHKFSWLALGFLGAVSAGVGAALIHGDAGASGQFPFKTNSSGQVITALTSGEDQTNNVTKVEQRMSVCIDDADIVCNAAPGFLHSVWCYPEDAAPTAGSVRVTNTTAAGGAETTEVWGMDFVATGHVPVGQVLDIEMTTGIVIDFTTTADMKCAVSYRDNG